ncbi:dTDP-4-dehydrorhamnose 3,5-epimerase [Chondrinema litorale]|uniref:dTDP-4-dehydrorhamnose 3,5-epimerase n=1 Tax=Chondrinema litorale TaxID=2994555 RepID=UPI0025435209|nr:dTDP-4-dehydrorhamnose 3,5-epimerase [Chondrinema litorale]UZS00195.1 dTDP-4-dehydrorhamnose 3,5-epimerase [Chondrinema litorale]
MQIEETYLKGCFTIKPQVFKDKRGFFLESFNQKKFTEATGISPNFVQDNQSSSVYGVLRGLHYQLAPYSQAKLVSVVQGEVLDVCVDIRKGSPTFGKSFSLILNEENKYQLFVPKGFAHGFVVTSKTAIFQYKCDEFYNPEMERGIIYNDPEIGIDWGLPDDELIISDKDQKLLPLSKAENNFTFEN